MLSVKNVSIDYSGNVVLDKLSFDIKQPGFIALCGHNGCGKSSLLKAICGKVAYQGTIEVNAPVGYLAQANHIGFNISVLELLLMGRFRRKHFLETYDSKDREAVKRALGEVGMAGMINKDFQELSGGQQQLVWILQTLIQEMDIYLFDEPTQNLDIRNKSVVMGLLQEAAHRGKTVLCVTHDLEYLQPVEGMMINLSKPHPFPEPISSESVQANIDFLKTAMV